MTTTLENNKTNRKMQLRQLIMKADQLDSGEEFSKLMNEYNELVKSMQEESESSQG